MKVYLAGSARNAGQFHLVRDCLRAAGHEVHDWTVGPASYGWNEVGIDYPDTASVEQMRDAGTNDLLQLGMHADLQAIDDADVFVLLLPCGADAHMEFGMFAETGRPQYILTLTGFLRASQFYAMADGIFGSVEELLEALK